MPFAWLRSMLAGGYQLLPTLLASRGVWKEKWFGMLGSCQGERQRAGLLCSQLAKYILCCVSRSQLQPSASFSKIHCTATWRFCFDIPARRMIVPKFAAAFEGSWHRPIFLHMDTWGGVCVCVAEEIPPPFAPLPLRSALPARP